MLTKRAVAGVRRRGAVPVALAASMLVLAACQSGVWMGDASAPAVAVIGDSLIYQAEGNVGDMDPELRLLADELVADGFRAHVTGFTGETVTLGHERLWPVVADEPLDTLVIALGSNDARATAEAPDGAVPIETSRSVLRQWLVEASDVRCVALIGLNIQAHAWSLEVTGPAYNQMLQEEAALHPNAFYVEWHPDLAIHGTDGDVHFPTPESQAQYRTTIRGAVDRCAATRA